MTNEQIALLLMFGLCLILITLYIWQVGKWRRRAKWAELQRDEWKSHVDGRANIANQYLQACRLISIHRDGRTNLFTFARGDAVFTIETMGLLGDDVVEWKQQAGLM